MVLPRLAAAGVAALVLLPVLALAVLAAAGTGDLWPHLLRYVLPQAALESLLLLAGVGALTLVLGTGTAWLVTQHDFPGRRVLGWALLLPFALPTYVAAYAWLDVLHPTGPLATVLRAALGIADQRGPWLPEPRSRAGCVLVLGFVLYPYVHLSARAAFLLQGAATLRAARSLGASGWTLFRRVGLPLARPALAVGTALALMEALNDVGASEFLGVRTLTVSIYVTWLTRSSLEGAAQIALVLLGLVSLVLLLERWGRRARAFDDGDGAPTPEPARLDALPGLAACAFCALPVLLGFVVPAAYLARAAFVRVSAFGLPPELGHWIGGSALYAALGTALTLAAGLLLAACARLTGGGLALRVAMLGYALPGGVAAVGLITAFGWLDDAGDLLAGVGTLPALSGSGAALLAAYLVRFLAIPTGGLEAAYARLPAAVDLAASSLGCRSARLFHRVHLPMLTPALAAAALLVFLDAMKELPATLLLRPLNVETLATALYGEAARGTYEEGAVAALCIVLVGLLPVLLLARGAALAGSARRGSAAATRPGVRPRPRPRSPMLPARLSLGLATLGPARVGRGSGRVRPPFPVLNAWGWPRGRAS